MYARRFIGLCSLCGDSFFVAGGEEGACERERAGFYWKSVD